MEFKTAHLKASATKGDKKKQKNKKKHENTRWNTKKHRNTNQRAITSQSNYCKCRPQSQSK